MRIAVMQPYFLPYLGYFQLMRSVDRFIVLDDVAYIKKGWINRNRLLVDGGEHLFTVPLEKVSQNKTIAATLIDERQPWRAALKETVRRAYRKAPRFTPVFGLLETILANDDRSVASFVVRSLAVISDYAGIAAHIVPSSSGYGNAALKGRDRIIDICVKERADAYHNAIGGVELYDRKTFADAGIDLKFVKPAMTPYRQFGAAFVPGLSILDVLMFNAPDAVAAMLDAYTFV